MDIYDATAEACPASRAIFDQAHFAQVGNGVQCTLNNYDDEGTDRPLIFSTEGNTPRVRWRNTYRAARALLAGWSVYFDDCVVWSRGGRWHMKWEVTDGRA